MDGNIFLAVSVSAFAHGLDCANNVVMKKMLAGLTFNMGNIIRRKKGAFFNGM
jgi:hypothetical protein